jgi:hypothetical protein
MTHLWPDGTPILVERDAAALPQAFVWQGRTHQVRQLTNQWRIDQDWWQERVWRDYFKLITQTGLLVIIYCDLLTGQWYLQRLYD